MTIELNPKMKPIFDCLKNKLNCTEEGIQDLKNLGVLKYYDFLTIKYYFNSKGQVRFKVKHLNTKNGFIYTHDGVSFKPENITNKGVKKFEKVLSKFLDNYVSVFAD